ncbi:MAG: ThuA domain-containing protein [Acidobacteria bacterium]|nr:ThuA domain-containing protein [Acidobacteriota bacterium]
MTRLGFVLISLLLLGSLATGAGLELAGLQRTSLDWTTVRLLFYTKNGTGYVHDNIPASIEAINELAREHRFSVDVSNDPGVFTDDNLTKYSALVFSNTNNVVFDTDAQRVALMRYVQAGGGFVGIHSASGAERTWKWFAGLLGGAFSRHAPIQRFGVLVLDRTHPSLAHLPARWDREDECYYLVRMNVNMQILAVNDLTTIQDPKEKPSTFGDVFPSVWYQEFDGGRQWYTSLGHRKEDYAGAELRRHLLGGIESVVRETPRDYSRAYAVSPGDAPRTR